MRGKLSALFFLTALPALLLAVRVALPTLLLATLLTLAGLRLLLLVLLLVLLLILLLLVLAALIFLITHGTLLTVGGLARENAGRRCQVPQSIALRR